MKKYLILILILIFLNVISISNVLASTTVTDNLINTTGNVSFGEKITFTLGEVIDNVVDSWIRVNGGLNVTENVTALNFLGNINHSYIQNQPNYLLTSDWNATNTSYYLETNPFGFYNSTDFSISDYLLISNWNATNTSYYLETNPFDFWNNTYATFNKTYADTLYADISVGGGSNPFDQSLNTTDSPIFEGLNITNSTGTTGLYQGANGKVGVNTLISNMLDSFTVTDGINLIHTATQSDDHAFEIDFNAAGFGDAKAIDIVYTTGAISAGKDEGVILINIDESAAVGGEVFGLEILATEGSAGIYGMKTGILIGPIHQDSGVFGNMDSLSVAGTDRLTEALSSSSDVSIFVSDNDNVTIGDAAKFEELEFLLNTTASGVGIKPTFEYSTGVGTWGTFTPVDGTNGMRNTGVIAWEDEDIPTWAAGAGSEYLIRITRTQNSIATVPIEDKIQISAVTEYIWDKSGNLRINEMNSSFVRIASNITTATCNAANEGSIYYDGDTNKHYGCDATNWNAFY